MSSGVTRNESQMARGGISGDRGRGSGNYDSSSNSGSGSGSRNRAFKKAVFDRDSDSCYFQSSSRSKFQESLKNYENRYCDDKKSNEDSRISKLLRRLCREDNNDQFLVLCKQLQESIFASDNQRYIKRNLDVICESLLDILHSGPSFDAKQYIAKCLGSIGYVANQDFKRFMDWIFNKYSLERKNDVKYLLMKSLGETFQLDAEILKLKDYSLAIMCRLQMALENVDRADLFISTVDSILLIVDLYPECFTNHFRDIVDILVGWHIDSSQKKSVLSYASRSLQRLRRFWIADLQFTLTLLGQFLEDMESYDEELYLTPSGRRSLDVDSVLPPPGECILRITSLISVFNTVLKCIEENLCSNMTPRIHSSFLTDCLTKMLKIVVKTIEPDHAIEMLSNSDTVSPQENINSIIHCTEDMSFSQKSVSIHSIKKEEDPGQLTISLHDDCNNKTRKLNEGTLSTLRKEKQEPMINLFKSMNLRIQNVNLSEVKEDLVIVANECTFLLVGYLQGRISKNNDLLYIFLNHQLQYVSILSEDTIVSLLNLISKIIKEVSSNLPLELVHTLLGKRSKIANLRFHSSIIIQNAVLEIYHGLLNLKNIPLLQEAYRHILGDLEKAFQTIVPENKLFVLGNPFINVQYHRRHAETVLLFLLRALSDIANASNSIIGMWALKPSILDLLAVKLTPQNPVLLTESPLLQYHIFFLLYTHCSRYNHFVPNSNLITSDGIIKHLSIDPDSLDLSTSSPTSGHLSVILNLIATTVQHKEFPEQTLLLLLNWMHEIYVQAEKYIDVLRKTEEHRFTISSLLMCGKNTNHNISIAVCRNIESLLNVRVSWSEEFYSDIVDLAIIHLTSLDKLVREKYAHLLMSIPLNIVMPKFNKASLLSHNKKFKDILNYSSESLTFAQRLYMRANNGEMPAQYFRTYMAFLLRAYYFDCFELSEVFTLCWPTVSVNTMAAKMYELALLNRIFLFFWCSFEAAQHCVLSKLRTPLGKPQETFTTIEGALKILAREISCIMEQRKKEQCGLNDLSHEHSRVRMLIEFLEHLERVIHNAGEGCAVALSPYSKPVRTFFHTNKSTCKEWLSRIRLAICIVSLHAGLATSALRNGQILLQDLIAANNVQGLEFERATLLTAQAMVILGEAEALEGLYIYTKGIDRNFTWLKAAIEEAAEKYELASENYRQFLEEQILFLGDQCSKSTDYSYNSEKGDYQVILFCMEHLSRCYRSICDWKHLEMWKFREVEILNEEKNSFLYKEVLQNITLQQAVCLRKFDEAEELSLEELSNWTILTEEAETDWTCAKTIMECSNTLTNVALKFYIGKMTEANFQEDLDRCRRVAIKIMEEGLRNVPSEYLNESILVQYLAIELDDLLFKSSRSRASTFGILQEDKFSQMDLSLLMQFLWWSDFFEKVKIGNNRYNKKLSWEMDASLRVHVVYTARKKGNFCVAQRELAKYLAYAKCGLEIHDYSFENILKSIMSEVKMSSHIKWSKDNIKAFREMSKLLYAMERRDEAIKVCSIAAFGILKTIVATEEQIPTELSEVGTRVLLTLAKWIQQDTNVENNFYLNELLNFGSLHNIFMDKLFIATTELIPALDLIAGKLMQLGVIQCPDFPTAWSHFAAWCYKWGRKIVDNASTELLTEIDKKMVAELLPVDIIERDLNTILNILDQKNRVVLEDEGDIDVTNSSTAEYIESLLRSVPALNRSSSRHLNMLVDIWRQAQARIYSYYELSAHGYFKYLQLAKGTNDCKTIIATLRLLRLVVKHASELQNVLESGLSTTATGPWKEIIPQLFSRLSHPECYVRTRVSELLCRVAENLPHLITFPAVVGAVSNSQAKNPECTADLENISSGDAYNSMNSFLVEGDVDNRDTDHGFMNAYFLQLTDCLSKRIPDSVYQVKILVRELRRITLLWDELCLATICQHHSDINKRFEQLQVEIQKVECNLWLSPEEKDKLIAEKHRIILKPLVFILENLLLMTSVSAETPHEKYFQEKFGPCIDGVIDKLKNPKCPAKPEVTFLALKKFEAMLVQKVNKRCVYSLLMSEISPVLAKFEDTYIAMPGICTTKLVTIKSVENIVHILPTKTKPKKLVFRGSDGHIYTYLFKGLEDLHLDERIMQFLNTCNTMMSKNSKNSLNNVFRARHYSVIPLGPRSGLIQWVDGVTPLFALYKRWQHRESGLGNKSTTPAILRPSELFYSKLTPLLNDRGIATDNRKEWPLSILKQVLAELMIETPKDLLSKEIWCNSINAGSWWQATKNYSYSVAVMSIIGYIIGLGDRHLDNVLVDFNTGEIVHIDYNVCFEKGKTLRVPEKVPFRMTPNIRTALGVTGVEGIFRLACEHTLRVMRRGRETLLTLLEAFVYDPLVDWRESPDNNIATFGACQARARCTGFNRKQLELELTTAMFAVRIAEIRTEWLANKNELLKTFRDLSHSLNRWIRYSEASQAFKESLQDRHGQLALIKEAQAMGRNHELYSLIDRYNTFKQSKNMLENASINLKQQIKESQNQISRHNVALEAMHGSQLNDWLCELNNLTIKKDQLVFDLVKEFLQNAGQSQMILQCEQAEHDLSQLTSQQSVLIRNCLDLLSQYSAIFSLYPLRTINQHRSVLYHNWMNKILTTSTAEVCREVLADFKHHFDPVESNSSIVQRSVTFSYQIQAMLNEANQKFTKAYERIIEEGIPEVIFITEKAYAESKDQIKSFLEEEGSKNALMCNVISTLCSLNKKYLMVEGAAKSSGGCLIDPTSRDGYWFLEELEQLTSLILEIVNLIPENSMSDSYISLALKCLIRADSIYKGLQELNYNFHTIILPEAIKTIITEEATVMHMITKFDEIIASTGSCYTEILEKLEMHLRFTIMDVESPHAVVQAEVAALKLRFKSLLSRSMDIQELGNNESLTPGQMLLMGFNGLFEKLQMEGNLLSNTLESLQVPLGWRKINQIAESKDIATPFLSQAAREVVQDIFFVSRLHTIQQIFLMCQEIASAFRNDRCNAYDSSIPCVYSDEQLNKPIRRFTAEYASRQLTGVISQNVTITICCLLQHMELNDSTEIELYDIDAESKVSLEDLCKKLIDISLKREYFNGSMLIKAKDLIGNIEHYCRRKHSLKMLQQAVESARVTVQRLQLQLTAHCWLHEDYLVIGQNVHLINPLNRSSFMLELRNNTTGLSNFQVLVNEARELQHNLVTSAVQRLKWASGANPALSEVMAAFDNAVYNNSEKLTRQANLSTIIANVCNSILHYEALRTKTQESMAYDTNFVKLVKCWKETCMLSSGLAVTISPIEESLMDLLHLSSEDSVDANWVKQAEKLVSGAIIDTQKELQIQQEDLILAKKKLKEQVVLLQAIIAEHHRLMNDVRLLLKSMAKQENIIGLQDFLSNYRLYTESLSATIKELECDNLELMKATQLKVELETLIVKTPSQYDVLLTFANNSSNIQNISEFHFNRVKLNQQENSYPRKGLVATRDPSTGKAIQECNAYALNVWRRVRVKLEGRDPDPNRKYTTNEQVDYVIREAESIENLALLYEGWTPWV